MLVSKTNRKNPDLSMHFGHAGHQNTFKEPKRLFFLTLSLKAKRVVSAALSFSGLDGNRERLFLNSPVFPGFEKNREREFSTHRVSAVEMNHERQFFHSVYFWRTWKEPWTTVSIPAFRDLKGTVSDCMLTHSSFWGIEQNRERYILSILAFRQLKGTVSDYCFIA